MVVLVLGYALDEITYATTEVFEFNDLITNITLFCSFEKKMKSKVDLFLEYKVEL